MKWRRCDRCWSGGIAGGIWQGPREQRFSTGAPIITSVTPWPGSRIAEDQHFLLRLNGAVDAASVRRAAWCEIQGLLDRLPVVLVDGAARDAVLRQQGRRGERGPAEAHALLLRCDRPLVADAKVRLVWGAGIGSPAAAGVAP